MRAPVVWGVVIGGAQAASPLAFWWLDPATVYALGLVLIAAVYKGATRCTACVARGQMRGTEGWDDPTPERQWTAAGGRRRVSLAEVPWIQAHVGAVSVGMMAERLGLSRSTVTGIRTGRHRLSKPNSQPST